MDIACDYMIHHDTDMIYMYIYIQVANGIAYVVMILIDIDGCMWIYMAIYQGNLLIFIYLASLRSELRSVLPSFQTGQICGK